MGFLGNGVNKAFIYDRRGERKIAEIESTQSLRWTRSVNAISEADVTIATGSHDTCCSIYGNIGTWGHSLVIFRNGVRSWEGPITNIRWKRGGVAISAHDVLGWSMRRITSAAIVNAPPGVYVVDALYDDVGRIFAGDDPNVLTYRQRFGTGTGPQMTRQVAAYGGYFDDQLNELVKGGGMYTTVGRSIIVWPSTTTIGRLPTLFPTKYISGDVEIEEDGFNVASRVIAANDIGENGISAGGTPVDPFFGLLEELLPVDAPGGASLATQAEQKRETMYPAPLTVNVPSGSILSCEAPYDMRELVCGSVVNVEINDGLCRKVNSTQKLDAVEVTQDKDGEKVAITVTPVSGVLV